MRRAQSFCCGAFFFGREKARRFICRNIESLSSFEIFIYGRLFFVSFGMTNSL